MAAVDRNLLRAAVAEMKGFPKTPRPVIINESLEIARKFSSPESVNFINAYWTASPKRSRSFYSFVRLRFATPQACGSKEASSITAGPGTDVPGYVL